MSLFLPLCHLAKHHGSRPFCIGLDFLIYTMTGINNDPKQETSACLLTFSRRLPLQGGWDWGRWCSQQWHPALDPARMASPLSYFGFLSKHSLRWWEVQAVYREIPSGPHWWKARERKTGQRQKLVCDNSYNAGLSQFHRELWTQDGSSGGPKLYPLLNSSHWMRAAPLPCIKIISGEMLGCDPSGQVSMQVGVWAGHSLRANWTEK